VFEKSLTTIAKGGERRNLSAMRKEKETVFGKDANL